MSEGLKRILFIVFFILLVIAIGTGLYWIFLRPATTPPVTNPPVTNQPIGGGFEGGGAAQPGTEYPTPSGQVGLPLPTPLPGATTAEGAAEAQTSLLYDDVAQSITQSTDGTGARYYSASEAKFYRINTEGTATSLSNQTFPNVEQVTWGNNTDQAILSYPDGSNVYYDFRTQTQTTLPKHWEDFSFSSDDRQIVAKSIAIDPGARFLVVSDPKGGNPQAIEPLGDNAELTYPLWTPNNQIIAYATVGDPQGFDREQIILVGRNHENFRALQVEGRGFLPLWSPDGSKVLYSVWNVANGYRPELWLSGGNPETINQDRTALGIMTWADKCVWQDATVIYCAVPDTLPTGAGLQRELFNALPDSFYRIDLRSGAKTLLGKPPADVSVRGLTVTSDGNHLLFSDSTTGKLYDFRIP